MRSDAVRNQRAVLDAARDVLSESGIDASMELIASRAGVGVGTVYRHFPNKEELIDALVRVIIDDLEASATEALTSDGDGLEQFLRALGISLAAHRGYAQMLIGHMRAERSGDHLRLLIAKLVKQAKAAGQIGPWVTLGDVMTVVWGMRGVIETSGSIAPSSWQRHLDLQLFALRSPVAISGRTGLTADQVARIAAEPR